MDLDNMSKKGLKKLIQTYNTYIEEFDYSEKGKVPLSVSDFYDSEYQLYLENDENIKNIESQKDDLFIVYSTDVYQSDASRKNISYCSNLNFARQVVADLNRDSDFKYVISKAELDSEIVNEAMIEVYDGLDGLEWKSSLSNGEYNKFPEKINGVLNYQDNVKAAYDLLEYTGSISSNVLLDGLDYENTSLPLEKQEVLKAHIDSLVEDFKDTFKQSETDTKQKL